MNRNIKFVFNRMGEQIFGKDFAAALADQKAMFFLCNKLKRNSFIIVWDNFESVSGIPGTDPDHFCLKKTEWVDSIPEKIRAKSKSLSPARVKKTGWKPNAENKSIRVDRRISMAFSDKIIEKTGNCGQPVMSTL
ncbi:MAG: hypothetical protein R2941_24800 [Desulfobacterales bacterium]